MNKLIIKKYFEGKSLFYYLYFGLTLLWMEGVMRVFLDVPGFPGFMLLFLFSEMVLLGLICHILPDKLGKLFSFIFTIFIDAVYMVETIYCHIYGSFASVSQLGMSKDAVDTFGGAAMIGVKESLPAILLQLLPLLVLAGLTICKKTGARVKGGWKYPVCALVFAAVLHIGAVLILPLGGDQAYSPSDIYNTTFVLDKSEQQFGALVSLRLEMRTMIFGRKETVFSEIEIPDVAIVIPTVSPWPDEEEETVALETPAPTQKPEGTPEPTPSPEPTPEPPKEHKFDIDFEALQQTTDNEEVKQLDQYFNTIKPTTDNAFSGMFEGYNLIIVCCESYSPYLVSEEFTPMLYKLSHEGMIFNNFYNTICDNTSNSEYVLNMSLLPDVSLYSNGAGDVFNTFTLSKDNFLPFCYGNRLKTVGYRSYAFHNFVGTYYRRNETHENMGFDFKYMKNGLEYEYSCPTSDVNLIRQAKDFMFERDENGEITPFVSYFLTFSGHMPYQFTPAEHWFTGNDMAIKNQEVVQDMPYSDKAKAYLASQVELEYALEDLIASLQEEGIADKTLVVVTGDHYPYSLGLKGLAEIAGHKLDSEFDRYKGSFILWTEGMEGTIEVDTPCCTLDIMPTLYNLLGVEYDSRLIMGTDVFSDGPHAAILMDRSFVTDCVRFNANTGAAEITEEVTLPEGYIDAWNNVIRDKYNASNLILYNDYYRHLGLQEEVELPEEDEEEQEAETEPAETMEAGEQP